MCFSNKVIPFVFTYLLNYKVSQGDYSKIILVSLFLTNLKTDLGELYFFLASSCIPHNRQRETGNLVLGYSVSIKTTLFPTFCILAELDVEWRNSTTPERGN